MSLTLKYRWLAVSCRELNSAELCSLDPWIKRLQKERGSISKAWSYPGGRLLPQVPVTRVQYAHTYTRTHTHRHIRWPWGSLRLARKTPTIDLDVTRSSTRVSSHSLVPFTVCSQMPGFLDISPQRMACALLSLPSPYLIPSPPLPVFFSFFS